MDIFKALGITVGQPPSLVDQSGNVEFRSFGVEAVGQVVRKGAQGNPRDRLDEQLGLIEKSAKPLPVGTPKKAPKLPKDPAQIKEERDQKKEAGLLRSYSPLDELFDDLISKAGEGSRGGKIIGHTKSSKPIYDTARHEGHAEFTHQDHSDAQKVHEDLAAKATGASAQERSNWIKDHEIKAHQHYQMAKQKNPDHWTNKSLNTSFDESHGPRAKKSFSSNPFIKAAGAGGMVFDFGHLTGNPVADQATALLNAHGDTVQMGNASYQTDAYTKAIVDYVQKGDEGYNKSTTMFGNVDKEWSNQLNKPMDQQVAEAFAKGELADDPSAPAFLNEFNKTEITIDGQVIKATSETDAALIKMMLAGDSNVV